MVSYTRTVDGLTVDEDRCRVSGQVHVEPDDAKELHVGSDVMVVMLARVQGPTFRESGQGIVRVNVLKPLELRSISDPSFKEIIASRLEFDEALVSADQAPELGFKVEEEELVPIGSPSDEPVVFKLAANREHEPTDEVTVDDEILTGDDEVDEDELLAEWLEQPKDLPVPVGGGRHGQGPEADRLRRFLSE